MNKSSQAEQQLYVDTVISLGRKFASAAAEFALQGLQGSPSEAAKQAIAASPAASQAIAQFRHSYSAQAFDSYVTGALEALRANRGEVESLPWMANINTELEARKMLAREWVLLRATPIPAGGAPICRRSDRAAVQDCPSFRDGVCQLDSTADEHCLPWIECMTDPPSSGASC